MGALQDWARARADLAQGAAAGIVAVETAKGRWLSGIVWDEQTVLTAAENLEGERVTLRAGDDRFEASVAALDLTTDVAVLRARTGLAPPARGDSASLRCGQPVLLAGRDAGGPLAQWADVLSAGPAWRSSAGGEIARSIRLGLRLASALEGAGIFDADGALCAMAVPDPRRRALGIPVETMAAVAARVAQYGYLPQPYLGVRLQPVWLDETQRALLGRERGHAVLVTGVDAGSPAQAAGLVFGDLLLSLAERPVHSPAAVAREVGGAAIGTEVRLEVLRAGAKQTLAMRVGERPRH